MNNKKCRFLNLPANEVHMLSSIEDLDAEVYFQGGLLYFKGIDDKSTFTIDFLKGDVLFRLKSSGKKQPLLKAVDLSKNRKILDLTAGLGRDALTLAYHGSDVLALERHPLLYLMLKYARENLEKDTFFERIRGRLRFDYSEASDFLIQTDEKWDAIYLDPMYPHEDKTAKSKKDVEFLKKIAMPTENLEELLKLAISKAHNRVVLKRPTGAEVILTPHHHVEGSLVRFDVYFPGAIQ
jgi:16S rRNA (guanine1516-N2)-methyltransferase